MTNNEIKNAIHCMKAMIDEEVCEECALYGTTGTDHCEADCVRVAIKALEQQEPIIGVSDVPHKIAEFFSNWDGDENAKMEISVKDMREIADIYTKKARAEWQLKELKERKSKCKWIRYDYRTVCPQDHDIDNPYWRIPENRMDALKYCPYCGKEIEVTS